MHESQQEAKVQVKYLDLKNLRYSFNKMHFYLFFLKDQMHPKDQLNCLSWPTSECRWGELYNNARFMDN